MSPFHASSREKLTHATSTSHGNLYYPTYPNDFPEEVSNLITVVVPIHLMLPIISVCVCVCVCVGWLPVPASRDGWRVSIWLSHSLSTSCANTVLHQCLTLVCLSLSHFFISLLLIHHSVMILPISLHV